MRASRLFDSGDGRVGGKTGDNEKGSKRSMEDTKKKKRRRRETDKNVGNSRTSARNSMRRKVTGGPSISHFESGERRGDFDLETG